MFERINAKRSDAFKYKLTISNTHYSGKYTFTANLDILYDKKNGLPSFLNHQKINLNNVFNEEFFTFFESQNIEYFKRKNNVCYITKMSAKLISILLHLKFNKRNVHRAMKTVTYTKFYDYCTDIEHVLTTIFNVNDSAFNVVTTEELFNHV